MRTLTYFIAVSLDGRISGPADDFSAFPQEGDHIEWIVENHRDTLPGAALTALGLTADRSRFDTVIMGWNTYAAGFRHGVTDPYPHLDQYVASRTRSPGDVAEGITVTDDPVDVVQKVKEEAGSGIWLCGGGQLASALADEIDRLVLKVNPIVLGQGPALFEHSYDVRAFTLASSTPFGSGVVVNEYARR